MSRLGNLLAALEELADSRGSAFAAHVDVRVTVMSL